MLKLLSKEHLELLARHPELIVTKELVAICHQIFLVQSIVGVLRFIPAAVRHSLGMESILNVCIPVWGFMSTRADDFSPEKYRAVRIAAVYWIGAIVFDFLRFMWEALWLDWGSFLWALIGIMLKTAISLVQWIAFARLWRVMQDEQVRKSRFYLNIVVLNKEHVVKAGVQKKTGWGTSVGTQTLGRLAGKLANRMVDSEKFGAKLGAEMEKNMPEKLAENGVTAVAEMQYHHGNLLVMRVTVKALDIKKVLAQQAGEKKASKVNSFLQVLPSRVRAEFDHFMLTRAAGGLIKKMPENVARQLLDLGGLEVVVEGKAEEDEADYFFQLLKELDEADKDSKCPSSASGSVH